MFKDKLEETGLKGHCKISLFEGDRLVNTIEKDNFVTNVGKEILRRQQAQKVGEISGVDPSSLKIGNYDIKPFETLLLSTDNRPSTLDDLFLEGDLIGFADRGSMVTSQNPLQGTINALESYASGNKAHLVFDFGTDKANGTFQGIGFITQGRLDVSGLHYFESMLSESLINYREGFNIGNVYYLGNIGAYKNIKTLNIVTKEITTIDNTESILSLFQIRDKYYLLNSTGQIKELSSDFKTTIGEPITLTKTIPGLNSVLVLGDRIYMSSIQNSFDPSNSVRYPEQLYVFDLDFNFIKSIVLDQTKYGTIYGRSYILSKTLGGRITLDLYQRSSLIYDPKTEYMGLRASHQTPSMLDSVNKKMYSFEQSKLMRYFPSSLTTKIILPEPITKTNTQTMKIEYDFTY